MWLALAARLWGGLWVASVLTGQDGLQFMVASCAVGVMSTILLTLIVFGTAQQWSNLWVFAPSLLAHLMGAGLVLRSGTSTNRAP
jgi:hypothetical protein